MRHLKDLAAVIRGWAANDDRIRALLWYGTQALGTSSPFSDIDAAILHLGPAAEIVESLRQHLGPRVRECVYVLERGEIAIWVDDALTKIDLRLVANPEELRDMAVGIDVPAPRFVAVIDKDDACGELVRLANVRVDRSLAALVEVEIEKFLIGYEAASNAHRRSDGYRFYFEYNLSLHRLARLIELARGAGDYLFLPRMMLSGRLSFREQNEFRDLHGVLYLPRAQEKKRKLADAFLKIARELAERFPLRRSVDSMASFLAAVQNRDRFFNVRDFAAAFCGQVRSGQLFRASTLSRWAGTPELDEWLSLHRIVKVLDFRDPEEAAAHLPYPTDLEDRLAATSLPLSDRPVATENYEPVGDIYYRHFQAHIDNVAAALRIVAEAREGAVAVHCHMGRDRTGWFCATIGLLLDLDEDRIVEDYLLSGQGTQEESIRRFLALVAASGGATRLCATAGFGPDEVGALRRRLINADGPAPAHR